MKAERPNLFWKLLYVVIAAGRRLISELRGLAGLLRRRTNFIEERWTGINDGQLDGKVCVFVHFDRKGEVHDFVMHYLRALRLAGFSIVFVSNAPKLKPAALQKVKSLSSLILRRANIGYDFGGYKDGISAIPNLEKLEMLLLANDSVYGPFTSLAAILERTRTTRAQFWGLTDCWDKAYHLQSYFLLFGPEVLNHEAFQSFWRKVRYVNSKSYVIRKYEVGLSQNLTQAGLRGAAFFSSREASHAVTNAVRNGALADEAMDGQRKRYLAMLNEALERGAPLNVSHYLWDYLIVKMGYPFIKRELLQKNPVFIPHLAHWQEVIGSVSDYDTDLIVRHLEVTLRNRLI